MDGLRLTFVSKYWGMSESENLDILDMVGGWLFCGMIVTPDGGGDDWEDNSNSPIWSTSNNSTASFHVREPPQPKCQKLDVPACEAKEKAKAEQLKRMQDGLTRIEKLIASKCTEFKVGQHGLQVYSSEMAAESQGFAARWGGRMLRRWVVGWIKLHMDVITCISTCWERVKGQYKPTTTTTTVPQATIDKNYSNVTLSAERKEDFTLCKAYEKLLEGQAANTGGRFGVLGQGIIVKVIESMGRHTTLIMECIHTLDLVANPVSIEQFNKAGLFVTFGGGGTHPNRQGSITFSAKSLEKLAPINTWHRCFGHAGISTIKQALTKNLVDGLQDCVLGKQVARLYDGKFTKETEPLERVHMDIQTPRNDTRGEVDREETGCLPPETVQMCGVCKNRTRD
ncbi:hypothetical protein B0H34DRAFT_678358 [Crassisporium funariophilum]|nr:hypothetical protein B0H34DRAFT_678358 [Crassisporium funariophilum]